MQPAGMPGAAGKHGQMLLSRLFRRRRTVAAPVAVPPALDRSALLAELEVSVPAPERLVRWDTAIGRRPASGPASPTAQRLSNT